MAREYGDRGAELRAMSVDELRHEIARCEKREKERGLPSKARRSWKLARDEAETELKARESEEAT